MLHSTERILVTHTGSLPRPRELIEAMLAENEGRALDPADYEEKLLRSVHDIVRRQMDLGVDIVDDGELSKRGFAVYAHQRLDGLTRPPAGCGCHPGTTPGSRRHSRNSTPRPGRWQASRTPATCRWPAPAPSPTGLRTG